MPGAPLACYLNMRLYDISVFLPALGSHTTRTGRAIPLSRGAACEPPNSHEGAYFGAERGGDAQLLSRKF